MSEVERDASAGEYVLGTLGAAERAAFERAMADDPLLAAAVARWERRLAGLNELTPEQMPDARVWLALERALVGLTARAAGASARPASLTELGRLRRSRAAWRASAIAAGLIAAGLALFIGLPRVPPAVTGYAAVVDRGGTLPALLVEVDTEAGLVRVRSLAAEPPPGRSLQLWYIAAAGGAPRSLGLVEPGRVTRRLPVLSGGTTLAGATLAVSVEPPGGSPSGGPTGQIVYTGKLFQN